MAKKGANKSGGKALPRGGQKTRQKQKANYQNQSSVRSKLMMPNPSADPSFPREQCFRSCRAEPFTCEAACNEVGLEIGACRNPNGGRASVTRKDVYTVRCSAASGKLNFRLRPTLSDTIEVLGGTIGGIAGAADFSATVSHPALTEIRGAFDSYRMIGMGFKLETTQSFTTNEGVGFMGFEYPTQVYPRDIATDYDADYVMALPGSLSAPSKEGLTGSVPISGSCNNRALIIDGTPDVFSVFHVLPDEWTDTDVNWNGDVGELANVGRLFGDFISAVAISLEGLDTTATYDLIICQAWEGTPKSKFQPVKLPVSPMHASNARQAHHKKKKHAKKSWHFNDLLGGLSKAKDVFGSAWDGVHNVVNVAQRIPAVTEFASILDDAMDVGESLYEGVELFA